MCAHVCKSVSQHHVIDVETSKKTKYTDKYAKFKVAEKEGSVANQKGNKGFKKGVFGLAG